jgi:TonB family protein
MQDQEKRKTEPKDAASETVLERCLVEGDTSTKARDRFRRGGALGISFAIETIVLALLIVAPLLTSIAQPHLNSTLNMPIAFGGLQGTSEQPRQASAIHRSEKFHAHPFTFTMQPTPQRPAAQEEAEIEASNSSIGPLGNLYPPDGIPIFGSLSMNTPARPPAEIKKPEEKRVVRVSEPLQQAQLIARIVPRYPPLAVQTKKEGTVLLHAIISVDGRISRLEVVSGSSLFLQNALDAVRQWRYRPTYLDGQPVEVETSITVICRLGP